MARQFNLSRRVQSNRVGGLLDIPSTGILRYRSPADLVNDFQNVWGTKPDGVVLPITNHDGMLFHVDGLAERKSDFSTPFGGNRLFEFEDIVAAFARLKLDIYLCIDPSLAFMKNQPLQLIDIMGSSSQQACIGNPHTQDIVAAIIGTGVDIVNEATRGANVGKLKGVVIDVVDLWPMGGQENQLQLTCFCPSCEEQLESVQPGLVRQFKTYPNPWNLVLNIRQQGIDYVENIRLNAEPSDILGLSRQRGWHRVFEGASEAMLLDIARVALSYINARHIVTVNSVNSIFSQALADLPDPPHRILLTEGSYYDWTAGIQLERIDQPAADGYSNLIDEVWYDLPSTDKALKHTLFRTFMSARCRYFIDAFFQMTATVCNPQAVAITGVGRLSRSAAVNQLHTRFRQALASLMTGQSALAALPDTRQVDENNRRVGFVGVALTEDIGERLIAGLPIATNFAPEGSASGMRMEDLIRAMRAAQRGEREDDDT